MRIRNQKLGVLAILVGLFAASGSFAQSGPPALPTPPAGRMLNAWEFQATNWTSLFGDAPLSFTNLSLTADWAGNGLLMDSTNPASLNYAVVASDGWTNIAFLNGSIELWFSPDWNSTDGIGNWGTLLEVGTWHTNLASATGAWGIYLSPDGSNLGFSTQSNDWSTNYLTAPIAWNAGEWHHIVLTYSATNSALYLEGQLATNGPGVNYAPGSSVLTNGFSVGSDGSGSGLLQARGVFNNLVTLNYPLDANAISNIYAAESQNVSPLPSSGGRFGGGGFHNDSSPASPPGGYSGTDGGGTNYGFATPDYGTNLWLAFSSLIGNTAALVLSNTQADILYEIQAKNDLSQSNWFSLSFVYGSELMNWTPSWTATSTATNLFMRIRSWQDSTGTGIPDWWWLNYFGQLTNVSAYTSLAGDGLTSLQKFQMGLNPTNYYNPHPVPGFFGSLVGSNVVLEWLPASGPVSNYTVQRGVVNTNTGLYTFTQVALLASTNNVFVDVGAISNLNAQSNIYMMEALYPGGSVSATNTWQTFEFIHGYYYYAPAPPEPNSVNAYLDSTGTNVLMSWAAAQGPAIGYRIAHGHIDPTNYNTIYVIVGTVGSNTLSYTIAGAITNASNLSDAYYVQALYASNAVSSFAGNNLTTGLTNSTAGPLNFYGYIDGTGTNAYLSWSPSPGSPTGYYIFGYGGYNILDRVAVVGSNATSAFIANSTAYYNYFYIVATYANETVSQSSTWSAYEGPPAPTAFVACLDSTGSNVVLGWQPVGSPATSYTISYSNDGGNYWNYETVTNLPITATTFTDIDPFDNRDYFPDYFTNGTATYEIVANYPNGGTSLPVTAVVTSSPPPPSNLSVIIDSTGTNVFLSWRPTGVPATQYTILRGTYSPTNGVTNFTQIATVSGSATNYTDHVAQGSQAHNGVYEIVANYSGWTNTSPDISQVNSFPSPSTNKLALAVQLVRNETGRWQLMFPYIPTNVVTVALYEYGDDFWDDSYQDGIFADYDTGPYYTAENDILVASITNGIYVLPDFILTNWFPNNSFGKRFMIQPIDTQGNYGTLVSAGCERYDMPRFVDARRHLKQNLLFELREATITDPNFTVTEQNWWNNPFFQNLGVPSDTNYVESSIFHSSVMNKGYNNFYVPYVQMSDVWPLTVNYELHAQLYDTNFSSVLFNWQFDPLFGYYSAPWYFSGSITTNPAPPVLGLADPYWIQGPDPTNFGAYSDGSNLYLPTGAKNVYGLTYTTAIVHLAGLIVDPATGLGGYSPTITLAPGGSTGLSNVTTFYSQTVDPSLSLLDYYFAPVNTPGMALIGDSTPAQMYQLPTIPGFANTNQTALQIVSVGTPNVIGGWARYTISNGYSSKRAYLGQYFQTNAFVISNGVFTTNTTGIVSPYGDFFPTAGGTVAMVTLPDIDTGIKATNVVRVISLNTDANHDGQMNFSFFGPDSVSANHPFRFWINDNQDSGDFGGDGIPGKTGPQADGLNAIYPSSFGGLDGPYDSAPPYYAIHGRRDLVDFFPVYLNISSLFQSNALSAGINVTDTNWQVTLSQGDGALRFAYTDLTPTNYMNYLLDTNVSGSLANALVTTITTKGVSLPTNFLSGVASSNRGVILVEAWTNTTQPLVLTVYHGTNQIAQTSLSLSISGVEQMFRSKTLVLDTLPGMVPDRLTDASVPNEPDTIEKNFVFLHGYNVLPKEARGVQSDVFKRMYWSGSHAKFWGVTWEGADSKIGSVLTPNYHTNVVHAFQTAPILATFLATLTNSGPVVVSAHSLGNMLTLSAISDWNAPINQYFMLDAAVPLEAVDASATTNMMIYSTWRLYTNRLYATEWHNLFPTNDARSTLSWNDRLGNLRGVDVYNCYSSGEEVLRTYTNDTPSDVLGILGTQAINNLWDNLPFGTYTWYWQEKGKGNGTQDWFLVSSHGGWQFSLSTNYYTNYFYNDGWVTNIFGPSVAANTPGDQLKTNAFFQMTSPGFTSDAALYPTNGGDYAATNRARILSDAIPAMSEVMGANPIPSFDNDHNLNMNTAQFQNAWPPGRSGGEANLWHHSDFHDVAYTFTYKLYNQLIATANLK